MTSRQNLSYLLVVGHGRSGTNMMLDILDCHATTFCRNEPNELVGSAFRDLGNPMFMDPDPKDFETRWAKAVDISRQSNGHRDRRGTNKAYFRSPLMAHWVQYAMLRPRFRKLFMPRQDGVPIEEWRSPALYMDRAAQLQALPVFKILLCPAWTIKAHADFPGQRVVHVIRRPDDFIQSWWSRYVQIKGGGPEQVFAANQPSLARILTHFGQTSDATHDYSIRNLLVSELWRWRYVNEVLVQAIGNSPRYLQVPYEAAMADQSGWADKVFGFAGLEMDSQSAQAIGQMRNTLFKSRGSDGLDAALVEDAVAEVMTGSVLGDVGI